MQFTSRPITLPTPGDMPLPSQATLVSVHVSFAELAEVVGYPVARDNFNEALRTPAAREWYAAEARRHGYHLPPVTEG